MTYNGYDDFNNTHDTDTNLLLMSRDSQIMSRQDPE